MRIVRTSWLVVVVALQAALLPSVAAAATLRAVVEVKGSVVHLSDLFAGLEEGQDCVLGDSPPPGTRLVIQQPQLEAIASQFGVSWEPLATNARVVLDRQGRTVDRTTVATMLSNAFSKQYAMGDSVVTLFSFDDLTVDRDAALDVDEISLEQPSGQFHAVLVGSIGGQETLRFSLVGKVERLLTVVVPSRAIAQGEVIADQDLTMVQAPASRVRGEPVTRIEDAVALVAVRPLSAGSPISRSDLRRPDLVLRGGPVMMQLETAGIDVEAQGQALESGALDDRVRVLNPASHAVLLATVIGQSNVRIDPGSTPFVRPRSGVDGDNEPGAYAQTSTLHFGDVRNPSEGEP